MTLCALGGLLILVAASQPWASATVPRTTGGSLHLVVSGTAIEPGLKAVGIALLAMTLALLAGRGSIRQLAGLLILVVGVSGIVIALDSRGRTATTLLHKAFDPSVQSLATRPNAWWVIAALGAALAVISGALALLRGGSWTSLSGRYETPAATAAAATTKVEPEDDESAWKALDRGEDPTA